jgi:hypothetical protein
MLLNQIIPATNMQNIMRLWLKLAITSLAVAGLLSIALFAARTPYLQNYLPYEHFFDSALIVHVDLSVVIWLLSICSCIWCVLLEEKFIFYAKIACILSWIGMVLVAISPFIGENIPIKNNYIPVIINVTFFSGLSFFCCGIVFQLFLALFNFKITKKSNFYLCIYSTGVIALIAVITFILSHFLLTNGIANNIKLDSAYYYEMLFWGGGHILQFVFVQMMQVAWLILILRNKDDVNLKIKLLFIINLLFALTGLLSFFYPLLSAEFNQFFTLHMRYFGGVTPVLTAIYLIFNYRNLNSFFYCSVILFAIGGIIGVMITDSNVTIPAHYHGSIVAVTISFMGMVYLLMTKLGYNLRAPKFYYLQPIILTIGQILHVFGLAWSGGYGALRKTPGAVLSFEAQLGMGIMGFGGLLAVIGGIMFLYNSFSILNNKKHV